MHVDYTGRMSACESSGMDIEHVPWRNPSSIGVDGVQGIGLIEREDFRVHDTQTLHQTLVQEQVPLDDFQSVDASRPDSRIPDQRGLRPRDVAIRLRTQVEVRRRPWLRVQVPTLVQRLLRMDGKPLRYVLVERVEKEDGNEEG